MIKIFTFGANRPDFITLQMHSFRRHLQEDFELTVFDNSQFDTTGGADSAGMHQAAQQAGARVIDVVKDASLVERCQKIELSGPIFSNRGLYTSANVAHAYALCWAWENYISKETDPIAVMDSDVFLIEPIKLTDHLYPHQMLNVPDGKKHVDGRVFRYMWPTFMLADMSRLPDPKSLNWWCGRIQDTPVDVGGQTYHYFQAHPELDVKAVRRNHFPEFSYDEFYLGEAEKVVLHYRSGSDWDHRGTDFHQKKTAWLKQRIG